MMDEVELRAIIAAILITKMANPFQEKTEEAAIKMGVILAKRIIEQARK